MSDIQKALEGLQAGADVLFLLVGAILVFAMHGGFAFLEAGTVRHKNQVNALVQDPGRLRHLDGRLLLRRLHHRLRRRVLRQRRGPERRRQGLRPAGHHARQVLLPLHLRRGRAGHRLRRHRRARAVRAAVRGHRRSSSACSIRFFEGIVWNKNFGLQESFFKGMLGEEFHDFAGSIVVHAIRRLDRLLAPCASSGPRLGRYDKGRAIGIPPSSIPWLAMGSWLLCIGWFGFNVMSAQSLEDGHRPRRHELADGHVRRHPGGADRRRRRPGLHPQRRAGRPRRRLRRLRRHASDRLAVRRRRRRRHLRLRVPDGDQPSGSSTTCWASGRCTGCAACGAASPAASSGSKVFGGLGGVSFCLAARRQPDGRGLRRRLPASSSTASSTRCWG